MFANVPTGAWLGFLGALITVALSVPYAVAAWRGEIRPSWATWSIWTTTTGIAAAAGLLSGSTVGSVVAAAAFVRCSLTLVATLVAAARRRAHRLREPDPAAPAGRDLQWWIDRVCGSICAVTLVAWAVTGDPVVAIVLAIVTDLVAAVPTYLLAWQRQEQPGTYAGAFVNAACTVLILRERTFVERAYPIYELLLTATITTVVLVRGTPTARHQRAAVLTRRRTAGVLAGAAVVVAAVLATTTVTAAAGTGPAPVSLPLAQAPAVLAAAAANPAAVEEGAVAPVAVTAAALPTVRARIATPPTPGFIEMAPSGRYALIAHRTQMQVSVLDTTLGRITTTIATPQAPPRFVAFCPTAEDQAAGRGGQRAYLSMYDDPTDRPAHEGPARHLIGVLDTTTLQMIATIPVGSRPYAPVCSPDGTQLWVPSHDDAQIDVIDTSSLQVIRTIPVPRNPHWLAFSKDGSTVYAACHDENVVAVIDARTFAPAHAPIPVGTSPHSIAVSPDGSRLAVVNFTSNDLSVIDTATDTELHRWPTGENPQDVTWSADGTLVYTTNVDGVVGGKPVGNLSVVDVGTGVQQRFATGDAGVNQAPTSIARSADGSVGYVTNLATGEVTVYDLAAH
jgi:YVTN family beta-propeller protein